MANTALPNETLFTTGESYFNALLNDIAHAQSSIDLETYIFAADSLGEKIIDALLAAAKRGVHVRVHVDGIGSRYWDSNTRNKLESGGVHTRVFHPFPWNFWHWGSAFIRVPALLKIIYLLTNINARNHRKLCIIDKKIVYVGSFNISIHHLNKQEGGEDWRDTAIRLTNIDISNLQTTFDVTWEHKHLQQRMQQYFYQRQPDPIFRLNNTRKRRRRLYKNLLKHIGTAQYRIWITNAYFVPDNFLLKKLRKAANNGVDVRILLPHKSDVALMPWASATFYENLLKAGIRIFEYLPSMLHAKVLIIDDWMTIGSTNLNYRSLLHDLEIDVVVSSANIKQQLTEQFLNDLSVSKEITLADWEWRPWYKRWIGRILLYVKYLM